MKVRGMTKMLYIQYWAGLYRCTTLGRALWEDLCFQTLGLGECKKREQDLEVRATLVSFVTYGKELLERAGWSVWIE